MKKILVIGATSGIAQACVRIYAERGDLLFLVARNEAKLRAVAEDAKVRGAADAGSFVCDLDNLTLHGRLLDEAGRFLGGIDVILIAHGLLGDQKESTRNYAAAEAVFRTNFLSPVSLLTDAAARLEAAGSGRIGVITSIAGDRGRARNYVYGSSKGALSRYLEGLRMRLLAAGVTLTDIRPGFVETPMTDRLKKNVLYAQPAGVAPAIVRSVERGRSVVYVPAFWKLIMLVIRHMPEFIFKRMKL